ncbi:hypothetical protein SNEBB_007481 [Seison nebaliae]|nr:hypothetical protein SNEBB_007481 [Seison nebaliae]
MIKLNPNKNFFLFDESREDEIILKLAITNENFCELNSGMEMGSMTREYRNSSHPNSFFLPKQIKEKSTLRIAGRLGAVEWLNNDTVILIYYTANKQEEITTDLYLKSGKMNGNERSMLILKLNGNFCFDNKCTLDIHDESCYTNEMKEKNIRWFVRHLDTDNFSSINRNAFFLFSNNSHFKIIHQSNVDQQFHIDSINISNTSNISQVGLEDVYNIVPKQSAVTLLLFGRHDNEKSIVRLSLNNMEQSIIRDEKFFGELTEISQISSNHSVHHTKFDIFFLERQEKKKYQLKSLKLSNNIIVEFESSSTFFASIDSLMKSELSGLNNLFLNDQLISNDRMIIFFRLHLEINSVVMHLSILKEIDATRYDRVIEKDQRLFLPNHKLNEMNWKQLVFNSYRLSFLFIDDHQLHIIEFPIIAFLNSNDVIGESRTFSLIWSFRKNLLLRLQPQYRMMDIISYLQSYENTSSEIDGMKISQFFQRMLIDELDNFSSRIKRIFYESYIELNRTKSTYSKQFRIILRRFRQHFDQYQMVMRQYDICGKHENGKSGETACSFPCASLQVLIMINNLTEYFMTSIEYVTQVIVRLISLVESEMFATNAYRDYIRQHNDVHQTNNESSINASGMSIDEQLASLLRNFPTQRGMSLCYYLKEKWKRQAMFFKNLSEKCFTKQLTKNEIGRLSAAYLSLYQKIQDCIKIRIFIDELKKLEMYERKTQQYLQTDRPLYLMLFRNMADNLIIYINLLSLFNGKDLMKATNLLQMLCGEKYSYLSVRHQCIYVERDF